MNILGSHFLDKYNYKYNRNYQKLANMVTNTIIWTYICEYEYRLYHTQNRKKYIYNMFVGYKGYKSMLINEHMCNNIQFVVCGLKLQKILNF